MALTQSARGGGVAVLSGFDHRNPKHPKIVISSDDGRRAGPGRTRHRHRQIARTTARRGCGRPGSSDPESPRHGYRGQTRRAATPLAPDAAPPRAGDERLRRADTLTAKRPGRHSIGFSNSAHPTPHFSLTHSHSNREKTPVRIIFFTIANKSYSLTLSLDSLNTHTHVTQS